MGRFPHSRISSKLPFLLCIKKWCQNCQILAMKPLACVLRLNFISSWSPKSKYYISTLSWEPIQNDDAENYYIFVITDAKYFTTQFVNKESLLVSIVEFGIQMFSLHVLLAAYNACHACTRSFQVLPSPTDWQSSFIDKQMAWNLLFWGGDWLM